jgi:uncharacterized protein (DUF1778 family)
MIKTSKVELRVTDKEKEVIKQAAEIVDLSISDYIRERILDTSRSIVLVNENKITEKRMIDMEKVKSTYLSMKSATADIFDET